MPSHLPVLVLSALFYSTTTALNIPHYQSLIGPVSQDQALQNLTTGLGSGHEYECIKGSSISFQQPEIKDCKEAIRRLPKPSFHESSFFHRLGEDNGFRLPQSVKYGACHVLVDMKAGFEQDQGSWQEIVGKAADLLDRCATRSVGFTGAWATQGVHSGMVIHLMREGDRDVSIGASNDNEISGHPNLSEVNQTTGIHGLVVEARDVKTRAEAEEKSTVRERRALPLRPPSPLILQPPGNLTALDASGVVTCSTPLPFGRDKRPRYVDCGVAIRDLPFTFREGLFHHGGRDDDFQLPRRKIWGTCVVEVDLRTDVAGATGRWTEIRQAAELLDGVCKKVVKGVELTGGKVTAGYEDGLKIKLFNSGVPVGVGIHRGLLGGGGNGTSGTNGTTNGTLAAGGGIATGSMSPTDGGSGAVNDTSSSSGGTLPGTNADGESVSSNGKFRK